MPRFAAVALGIAAVIAAFLGAMYLHYSGDTVVAPRPTASPPSSQIDALMPDQRWLAVNAIDLAQCRWPDSGRIGRRPFITDPVESTLADIRAISPCNQPDPSSAKATPTTWDTAHATVQARGGFIPKSCEPQCLPDDTTKAWLIEVRGSFLPPPDLYPAAMVPDSPAGEARSAAPVPGTWYAIVPVLNY